MFKIDENYSDYYKTDPVKYPGGGAVNSSGVDTTDGTPWLAKMFDNCVGWMQALYIKAFGNLNGISNEAENAQTSDVLRALDKIRGDNNASERALSDAAYFRKTGGTISGDVEIEGDTSVDGKLHVRGDLLVDGTGEEVITTDLKVGADTIEVRDKNPSGLAAKELSGVVVHNYDGNGKNIILAVDRNGNARVGDIAIATRLLYSEDGESFFEDEALATSATIGQNEFVRDTGNTTTGGVKIYEGTTFSDDDTEPIATRAEAAEMQSGYGVIWNGIKKRFETAFIPSGAVIPQEIQDDTTVSGLVSDKCLYITAASAVTVTLEDGGQVGVKVRIINTTSVTHTLSLASVSVNVPHVLPMANIEIMWNGAAWQHVGGCAVGETFEQKPQCDSPFDVFPCSGWVELISHNAAFYRSANAPTTLYSLDGVSFYADVERLNPVDWSGIKKADDTAGTVTDTGNTQFNSRGEEMKIYTGSWTSGNAADFIDKTGDLVAQEDAIKTHYVGSTISLTSDEDVNMNHRHSYNIRGIASRGSGGYEGQVANATTYYTSYTNLSHRHKYNGAEETRPINYTVRIWKRIS